MIESCTYNIQALFTAAISIFSTRIRLTLTFRVRFLKEVPICPKRKRKQKNGKLDDEPECSAEENKETFLMPKKSHRVKNLKFVPNSPLSLRNKYSILDSDSYSRTDSDCSLQSDAVPVPRQRKSRRRPRTKKTQKPPLALETAWETVFVLDRPSKTAIIVPIHFNHLSSNALCDSGAVVSCLSVRFVKQLNLITSPTEMRLMSANSTDLNAEIAKDVTFEIQGKTFTQNFYVCNIRTHDVILGCDFFKKHETLRFWPIKTSF